MMDFEVLGMLGLEEEQPPPQPQQSLEPWGEEAETQGTVASPAEVGDGPVSSIEPTAGALVEVPELPPLQFETQNVVTACWLGTALELKDIAVKARNAEFNPKKFPACVIRLPEPRATALVFKSGKMIVTGAKDFPAAKRATKKFALLIRRLGFDVTLRQFRISNMVGTMDVKLPVAVEQFAAQFQAETHYEPEIFPGAMYYMTEPRCVCTVFCSGRLTIAGLKSLEDLEKAARKMDMLLADFKMDLSNFTLPE
eukprot:GGOE01036578.1.p1 GENE.GGOE01036578.1~~GGOE01036578.1.p1  ORF type:complete len:254 (+),score=87.71 GGOE01036578.1:100-861(+)